MEVGNGGMRDVGLVDGMESVVVPSHKEKEGEQCKEGEEGTSGPRAAARGSVGGGGSPHGCGFAWMKGDLNLEDGGVGLRWEFAREYPRDKKLAGSSVHRLF